MQAYFSSRYVHQMNVPPVLEHERQLEYTKWRTYQCSHLLENIKHEYLDAETRVDDHYLLEKARETVLGYGMGAS